ncbi:holo-ACP synthase [Echinimonas agarilytica]|uniref:Holo-[acyl-carrier-protein] synthase n=1 Tax=Echinimonas agarilytica TaxID=1215918 RepID=A0AA41W4T1_9GAMM|nr:holo-ACP synthase [Echinimonas agarilytica]MCM2678826.1 holo-ACP synthase [Echinimonas agarilytica]
MAIIGLGNDLVEISRIEAVVTGNHCKRFVKRVLTDSEQEIFNQHSNPERFLAKRWAAKEAAAKALGTGVAGGVSFQDFNVHNKDSGQPVLTLSGIAKQLADKAGVRHCWLSLSDEKDHALATVVLES